MRISHAPASNLHPDALLGHHLADDGRHKPSHGCPGVDNFLALAEWEASEQRITAASSRRNALFADHANLCLRLHRRFCQAGRLFRSGLQSNAFLLMLGAASCTESQSVDMCDARYVAHNALYTRAEQALQLIKRLHRPNSQSTREQQSLTGD